jgi:hypothetical protein
MPDPAPLPLPGGEAFFIDAAAHRVAAAVPNLPFPILPCRGAEEQRRTEVGPPQAVAHPWMSVGFGAHALERGVPYAVAYVGAGKNDKCERHRPIAFAYRTPVRIA